MYHQAWTARDGVPPNIEDMVQGADGLLWLSTDAGLYVFDGITFRRYFPTSGDHFLSAATNVISVTRDGSLWLSYSSGGLARLKNGRLKNFTSKDGLQQGVLGGKVVEGTNDVFWLIVDGSLQSIVGSTVRTVGSEYGQLVPNVHYVAVDGTGDLWIVSRSQLLMLPPGSNKLLNVPQPDLESISAGVGGSGSDLWLAQQHGPITHYAFSDGHFSQTVLKESEHSYRRIFAGDGSVSRMVPDRPFNASSLALGTDGAIWVGTSRGILRFPALASRADAGETSFNELFDEHDGLSDNFVFASFRDQEGSMWFATSKGLDRFREIPFHAVNLGHIAPVILPHGEPGTETFFATNCLFKLSKDQQRCLKGSYRSWTRSLFRARDGALWIGTKEQLWLYRGHRFVPYPLPPTERTPRPVLALAEDRTDRLWVSLGSGYGMFRQDGKQWKKNGNLSGFPNAPALAIDQDPDGDLWFAFMENWIVHLQGEHLEKFSIAEGLDLGAVKVFAFSGRQVFAGGEKGVVFLRSGRFVHLRFAGDSAPLEVTGLAFGPDESLWVNSSTGVFLVDRKQLAQALLDPQYAVNSQSFDSKDGLNGLPHIIVGLGSIFQAPDKLLYIATRENLQRIDPADIQRNPVAPVARITAWKADQEEGAWPTEAVQTGSGLKTLQIEYTAGSLLIPERVRFRYRLEGYDASWIDAGTRRVAIYSKVPPGDYTFEVLACNNSGVWSQTGTNFRLIVPPTFFQTVAFRSVCVTLIAASLILLYRLRISTLTKHVQERFYERLSERERIARDLHDTFFQSIQGLLLRFNTITSTLPAASHPRVMLEETLMRSDQVMREGRQLILDLRNTAVAPGDLPAALADFGRQLQADYDCEFTVAVNGMIQPLNAAVSKELVMIAKEAIYNAFLHASAQKIEVELSYERHHFRLCVRDNGLGVDAHVLESGRREGHWGLPGMRERASRIAAALNIWSRPGAGTEIEVCLTAQLAFLAHLTTASSGHKRR